MLRQCDSRCGRGTQSRTVWCVKADNLSNSLVKDADNNEDLVIVPDEQCNALLKPIAARDCESGPCDNVTAQWIISDWSQVSPGYKHKILFRPKYSFSLY
jgi:Thrombospondin type 1 domain